MYYQNINNLKKTLHRTYEDMIVIRMVESFNNSLSTINRNDLSIVEAVMKITFRGLVCSFALVGVTLTAGCDAASQFAPCAQDKNKTTGANLSTSVDCKSTEICYEFVSLPTANKLLCGDPNNLCGPDTLAGMACATSNENCRVIDKTDGTKGTQCVPKTTACAVDNGGCPTGTTCVALSETQTTCRSTSCSSDDSCLSSEFCSTPFPGVCKPRIKINNVPVNDGSCATDRQCVVGGVCETTTGICKAKGCAVDTDCGSQPTAESFCPMMSASDLCTAKHTVGQTCSRNGTAANVICKSNVCLAAGLVCGCAVNADCASGQVCNASTNTCQAAVACTGDLANQGCDPTTQFCNATPACETKHPVGGSCSRNGTPTPAMCSSGQCNSTDLRCGCTMDMQCNVAAGFKCNLTLGQDTTNQCIPDSASEIPRVRITATINKILGAGGGTKNAFEVYLNEWATVSRPYQIDNTNPNWRYVARSAYGVVGQVLTVDLPLYVVCGRPTPPILKATIGPNTTVSVPGFVMGDRFPNTIEFQVLNNATPVALYSDKNTTNMPELVTFTVEGINGNPAAKKTIDMSKEMFLQSSFTGPTGNLALPGSYFGCNL